MAKSATPKAAQKSSAAPKNKGSEPALSTGKTEHSFLEFFTDELRDIYWAENHLVKNLPRMREASASKELAAAIGQHLEETKTHVKRLEQIFELLGEAPRAKKCDAMEGLSKEAEGCIENTAPGTATRDVAIIFASQKVEHYEIATYGGLTKLAKTMGLTEVADILAQTLVEEKASDEKLTAIAENDINYEAVAE
jgi:ferritin-like metal-binding protein YciE